MNSLETKNVKRDYIVPDCQVHRYSYDIMQTVNPGSPPRKVEGEGTVDTPGRPSLGGAKEFHPWSSIWDDEELLEDE